jgi:hypothetical protein
MATKKNCQPGKLTKSGRSDKRYACGSARTTAQKKGAKKR